MRQEHVKHGPRTWLENDQVRFAFALSIVAAVLIVGIVVLRRGQLALEPQLGEIRQRLDEQHLSRAARALSRACAKLDCRCAVGLAQAGLDADDGKAVLGVLESAASCADPAFAGMESEALVRAGRIAPGARKANQVLAKARTNPNALQAQALAAFRMGATPEALHIVGEAVEHGRGAPAHLLAGVAHVSAGSLDAARSELEAALKAEPDYIDALFDLALVAQKQDRYGEARTLYLRVLRLRPDHKLAYYNVALLAHGIGADAEAKHFLDKLAAIAPGDPLVEALRKELAVPAPSRGRVLRLGATGN